MTRESRDRGQIGATEAARIILAGYVAFALAAACSREPAPGPEAVPPGSTAAAPGAAAAMTPTDFDLPGTAALVRDGRVHNGEELQRALNRGGAGPVDVDRDGRPDKLRVVERREGPSRTLEIRAVPSSGRSAGMGSAVPIAFLDFEPRGGRVEVAARYGPIVIDPPPPIVFEADVTPGTIGYWVLVVDRPVYVAPVFVELGHWHGKFKDHHKHHKWK